MTERRRVVVTGLGVATPLGLEVEENWQKLLAGISGIRRLECEGAERSSLQAVGAVSDTDFACLRAAFPEEAEREGERRTLFALWGASSALRDSGILEAEGPKNRVGVAMAAGPGVDNPEDVSRWIGGSGDFDFQRFGRELELVRRDSLMRNPSHRPAGLIAGKYDLKGPNFTVTTACASASQAIGHAFQLVRRGTADVMVAGGADSMINPVGLVFFVLLGAAAVGSGEPAESCRPFDRRRSGLVMGEGAGFIVLEEESHALRRGARIYATVAGYGSSVDAYRLTSPHPEGRGAASAMRAALKDAKLGPEEIDYINAHGTSTKLNDLAETLAVKKVFGDAARKLCISSSKSMIGHLLAASGGPELVYTVLTVARDMIHPTINRTNPDPKCDLDYVPEGMRQRRVRTALSNSFGFGGQNATIVVKKWENDGSAD